MDDRRFQDVTMISAPGAEESLALRRMAEEAAAYLRAFPWSSPISQGWLADGAGGIFALFLFELSRPLPEGGNRLWVVVGDCPRACIPVIEPDSPRAAVQRYIGLLDRWINWVMSFQATEWTEYPLELEPSLPAAKILRMKLDFLRDEVLTRIE